MKLLTYGSMELIDLLCILCILLCIIELLLNNLNTCLIIASSLWGIQSYSDRSSVSLYPMNWQAAASKNLNLVTLDQ